LKTKRAEGRDDHFAATEKIVDHRIDCEGAFKPHLAKRDRRWIVMWHRKSDCVIWSDPKDFADACRYLKLCDGPRLARLKAKAKALESLMIGA
jgi:hypothetical protein